MSLSTYDGLVTSLNSYLATTDYQSQYPDWVRLVESEVDHGLTMPDGQVELLRTHWQEAALALTATTGQAYIELSGIIEIRKIYLDGSQPSELVQESPQNYARFLASSNGRPKFFHQQGERLYLRNTPDAAYTLTGSAYSAISGLVANGTNWLMTNRPGAYLFGCLKQVALFQRTDDWPLAAWQGQYMAEWRALKASDRSSRWGGGPLRIVSDTGNP